MSAVKDHISITLQSNIHHLLINICEETGESKSAIIENALDKYLQERLDEDTKKLASMSFADLPNEDDWLILQNAA